MAEFRMKAYKVGGLREFCHHASERNRNSILFKLYFIEHGFILFDAKKRVTEMTKTLLGKVLGK